MLLHLARYQEGGYTSMVGLIKPGWIQTQAETMGIPTTFLMSAGQRDIGILAAIVRVIHHEKIRVMHAHEFYMSIIGAAASRLTGIPLVVTVHGKSYYPYKLRRRMAYRVAAMEAASLVTVSKDLQQFFCRTTGIPPDSVRVISNGIDLVPGMQSKRNRDRLGTIGIPPDAHVVGAVGNLYAVKGHIHLVRALRQIVQQRPNVHVVILGRGEEHEALLAEATGLGIADHLHLLGYCDDVQGWLNTMDVYAMPSLSEGLPLSLLEAMASTIPVVVTKVGGIPEVISDGETGFLVAVGDVDALACRIMLLLDQPSLAERMAKAGCSVVQQRFSLETMAGAYSALYQEAVARGGKTHASGVER